MNTKTREFKFLFIPGIILFSFTFISFALSSLYDLEIQEFLAQGFSFFSSKMWIIFFDVLGNFQFFPVIFIFLAIMWETLFIFWKLKTKKTFLLENQWILYVFYFAFAAFWIYFCYTFIDNLYTKDEGFGIGNDALLFLPMTYRITIASIIILFTSLIILISAYYIRFKFVQRNDVLIQEYWVDSIKGLLFIFLCYFMILFFKPLFGRPYYYSVIFNDILNNYLPENWVYDSSKYVWGSGVDGTGNVDYKNWWEINNFLENLKHWFSSTAHLFQTNGWINQDFPSGHTISTFCVSSVMFLFVNSNKKRKLTNLKISIIWIWFSLVLFNMKFSLVVAMTHWWTDVEFSTLFGLLMFFIVPKIVDSSQKRILAKIKIKNKTKKIMKNKLIAEFRLLTNI